jgi:endoglucanase
MIMKRLKFLVCLALTIAILNLAGCGVSHLKASPWQAAARRFLATYELRDGRVVRLDQGGDTVSEGQAYGMLLAQVAGDYGAFHRIWDWTRSHLQLADGLFSFQTNSEGKVTSHNPASDADLLIAWALLRYNGPGAAAVHRDGRRVAHAILAREVSDSKRLFALTAGPWATASPVTINPSYWSLPAMQSLAQLTGRAEWHRLTVDAVSVAGRLSRQGDLLPPNWAELGPARAVQPAPGGWPAQIQYGSDAQRTVVWFAVSCNPRARLLARRWWALLRSHRRSRALALSLSGDVMNTTPSVMSLVAAAAAAKAAGDAAATAQLLRRAVSLQRAYPTYYGGAWVALGLTLLTGAGLGACHP